MKKTFSCIQNQAFTVFPHVQLHRGRGWDLLQYKELASMEAEGRLLGKLWPLLPSEITPPHSCRVSSLAAKKNLWTCIHENITLWISTFLKNIFVSKKFKWIRICFKMSVPSGFFLSLFFFLLRQISEINMIAKVGRSFYVTETYFHPATTKLRTYPEQS